MPHGACGDARPFPECDLLPDVVAGDRVASSSMKPVQPRGKFLLASLLKLGFMRQHIEVPRKISFERAGRRYESLPLQHRPLLRLPIRHLAEGSICRKGRLAGLSATTLVAHGDPDATPAICHSIDAGSDGPNDVLGHGVSSAPRHVARTSDDAARPAMSP